MYKQLSRMCLRFQTTKGLLSVEQLWNLSLTDLSAAIKAVKKVLTKDNDDELSFLDDDIITDSDNELRFNILKDVYLTKKKEKDEQKEQLSKKVHNQKILELIASKKESELQGKSIEELEKMLMD